MAANPTVAQPTVVAQPLNVTPERRRLTGFFNLTRNEITLWWRTRRWLVNTITWVAILDGILAIMLGASAGEAAALGLDLSSEGTIVLMTLTLISLAIGAVIIGQGAIIDEKSVGHGGLDSVQARVADGLHPGEVDRAQPGAARHRPAYSGHNWFCSADGGGRLVRYR